MCRYCRHDWISNRHDVEAMSVIENLLYCYVWRSTVCYPTGSKDSTTKPESRKNVAATQPRGETMMQDVQKQKEPELAGRDCGGASRIPGDTFS
jgi:hypothetical protein